MDHEATRRGMQQHVGKRVVLCGDHPLSGKQGRAERVQDVNGAPALIIVLDDRTEVPITHAPHVFFIFESHEEELRRGLHRLPKDEVVREAAKDKASTLPQDGGEPQRA